MTRVLQNAALPGTLEPRIVWGLCRVQIAMNSSPKTRSRAARRPLTALKRRSQRSSGGLVVLCTLVYALVGYLVTALPPMLWLWPLALVGALCQGAELALGNSRSGWNRPMVGLLRLLGTTALLASLAIGLNFLGSDQLDDITIPGVAAQILLLGLLAAFLVYLCRAITQQLGHQLQRRLSGKQAPWVLALVGIVGLAIGGGLGLLGTLR